MEGGGLFCDVESVKKEEGVDVFMEGNDFWLKKEVVRI